MRFLFFILSLALFPLTSQAGEDAFSTGPVFKDFGPVADVTTTMAIEPGTVIKHSFDVAEPGADGEPNRTLVSAARFINMHARAEVPVDNIQIAVVVHGKASMEMADEDGASADLIAALTEHGVRIIVCGQSAAYYDVATEDLLPGVEMALSAMTAHALLQQQGYTINPF